MSNVSIRDWVTQAAAARESLTAKEEHVGADSSQTELGLQVLAWVVEASLAGPPALQLDGADNTVTVAAINGTVESPFRCHFDGVLAPSATQKAMYEACGSLRAWFEGYDAALMVCGGAGSNSTSFVQQVLPELAGAVFDSITAREEAGTSCQCSLQYVQFGDADQVADLLASQKAQAPSTAVQAATLRTLHVVHNISGQVSVQDAVLQYPTSASQLVEVVRAASASGVAHATSNCQHRLLLLSLQQQLPPCRRTGEVEVLYSQLWLLEVAAAGGQGTWQQLLAPVLRDALRSKASKTGITEQRTVPPCKAAQLLHTCLSTTAVSTLVVCLSNSTAALPETLKTLQLAADARHLVIPAAQSPTTSQSGPARTAEAVSEAVAEASPEASAGVLRHTATGQELKGQQHEQMKTHEPTLQTKPPLSQPALPVQQLGQVFVSAHHRASSVASSSRDTDSVTSGVVLGFPSLSLPPSFPPGVHPAVAAADLHHISKHADPTKSIGSSLSSAPAAALLEAGSCVIELEQQVAAAQLEMERSRSQHRQLLSRLVELEAAAARQSMELAAAESRAEAADSRAAVAEAGQADAQARVAVLEARAAAAEARLSSAEALCRESEAGVVAVELRAVAAESALSEALSREKASDAGQAEAWTKLRYSEAAKAEAFTKVAVMETLISASEAKIASTEKALKEAEARAEAAEARAASTEARRVDAEAGWREAEGRAAAAEARATAAETRRSEAEARIAKAEAQGLAAEAGRKQAELRATATESVAASAEAGWKDAEARATAAEAKYEAVKSTLASTHKQMEDRVVAAEALAAAAQSKAVAAEAAKQQADARAVEAEARANAVMALISAADDACKDAEARVALADARTLAAEDRVLLAESRAAAAEEAQRQAEDRAAAAERRANATETAAPLVDEALRDAEARAQAAEASARVLESRAAAAEAGRHQADARAAAAEAQAKVADSRAVRAEISCMEAEAQAAAAEARAGSAEASAAAAGTQVAEMGARASAAEARAAAAEADAAAALRAKQEADVKTAAAATGLQGVEARALAMETALQQTEARVSAAETRASVAETRAEFAEANVATADTACQQALARAAAAEAARNHAEARAAEAEAQAAAAADPADVVKQEAARREAEARATAAASKAMSAASGMQAAEARAEAALARAETAEAAQAQLKSREAQAEARAAAAELGRKDAQSRAATAEARWAEAEARLRQAEHDWRAAEARAAAAEAVRDTIQSQLQEAESRAAEAYSRAEAAALRASMAEAGWRESQAQAAAAGTEREESDSKLVAAAKARALLAETRRTESEARAAAAEAKTAAAQSELLVAELGRRDAEGRAAAAEAQAEAAKARAEAAESAQEETARQLEVNKAVLKELEEEVVLAETRLEEAAQQLADSQAEVHKAGERVVHLQAELGEARQQLQLAEDQLQLARDDLERDEVIFASNMQEISNLQKLLAASVQAQGTAGIAVAAATAAGPSASDATGSPLANLHPGSRAEGSYAASGRSPASPQLQDSLLSLQQQAPAAPSTSQQDSNTAEAELGTNVPAMTSATALGRPSVPAQWSPALASSGTTSGSSQPQLQAQDQDMSLSMAGPATRLHQDLDAEAAELSKLLNPSQPEPGPSSTEQVAEQLLFDHRIREAKARLEGMHMAFDEHPSRTSVLSSDSFQALMAGANHMHASASSASPGGWPPDPSNTSPSLHLSPSWSPPSPFRDSQRRSLSPGPSSALLRSAGPPDGSTHPTTLAPARERTAPTRSSYASSTVSRGLASNTSQRPIHPPWDTSSKAKSGKAQAAAARTPARGAASRTGATRSPARIPNPGFTAVAQTPSRSPGTRQQPNWTATGRAGTAASTSFGRGAKSSGGGAAGSPGTAAARLQPRSSSTVALPASQQRWLERLADTAASLRLAESQLQDASKQVESLTAQRAQVVTEKQRLQERMVGRQGLMQDRIQQLQAQRSELLDKQQVLQQQAQQEQAQQQHQPGRPGWLRRTFGGGGGGSPSNCTGEGSPRHNTAEAFHGSGGRGDSLEQEQEEVRRQLLVIEGQLQQLSEAEAASGALSQLQANAQQLIAKLSGLAAQLDMQLGEARRRLEARGEEANRLRAEVTMLRQHAPPMSSAAAAQALMSVVELMSGTNLDE